MNLPELIRQLSRDPRPEAENLRKVITLSLSRQGDERQTSDLLRRGIAGFAKMLRKPADLAEMMRYVSETESLTRDLHATFVPPDRVAEGGRFDVCDLRHWVEIARLSGVTAIPAEEILTLTEDELGVISGPVPMTRSMAKGLDRRTLEGLGVSAIEVLSSSYDRIRERHPDILARVEAASERLNSGMIVRSAICGSGSMKVMAGIGTLTSAHDSGKGENVEIGCGWVRHGNRTMIDVLDHRMTSVQLSGRHEETFRYLARPWVHASRRNEGTDPHVPLSESGEGARGSWPAEWRVYVSHGEVVAVANYYFWAGEVTPESARGALAARDAARRMIDTMIERGVTPSVTDLDVERLREGAEEPKTPFAKLLAIDLEAYPSDEIHMTLDFIETDDGEVVLLEGGPPHHLTGGAHPTAFLGCNLTEERPGYSHLRGVAFRGADGVHPADPGTELRLADHALDFEEVERIAGYDRDGPSPG